MKKLTSAHKALWYELCHKYKYFLKRGAISHDGSFYYDDKRLAEELDLSPKTIMRAKRALVEHEKVKITPGKYNGSATKYWVMAKPDKKSSFGRIAEGDKMSEKGDKMSVEGCQNVTPNKEIINREIKHFCLPVSHFENVFMKCSKDKIEAKRVLMEEGFSEFQVNEAFYAYEKKQPNPR